jgi:hypothetical protein
MLDAIDRLFGTKPRLATLLAAGLTVALGVVLNVEEVFAAGIVLALLVCFSCLSFVRKAFRTPPR